jgi:hypothetical protein
VWGVGCGMWDVGCGLSFVEQCCENNTDSNAISSPLSESSTISSSSLTVLTKSVGIEL